jgi:serine/threonine protein kinase
MKETIQFTENDSYRDSNKIAQAFSIISEIKYGLIVNNRYKIENKIGEGRVGFVFKAFDTVLNNYVALKFINPKITHQEKKFYRIKREVNVSRKITDERIVKIFSLEQWKGAYFLVMEFIEGKNLKEILLEKGYLKWIEFKPIFSEILEGVKSLHKNNILHRDLKPSNIIVKNGGEIKIIDFGLSKEIEDNTKTSSIGEIVGTPHYITPEQIRGEKLSNKSDIYQLGVILYTALTGNLPYGGNTSTVELLYKKILEPPKKAKEFNKDIPDFVSFAILKAMEKEVNLRFKTIEEFQNFLLQEKVRTIDRFFLFVKRKKVKKIALSIMFFIFVYSFFHILSENKNLWDVKYRDSKVIAYNRFGFKLWERNFPNYYIFGKITEKLNRNYLIEGNKSNKNNILPENKSVIIFLNNKKTHTFPKEKSIKEYGNSGKIVFLNNFGQTIKEEKNLLKSYIGEFVKSYFFSYFDKIKVNNNIFYFIKGYQSFGMYPSFFYLFKKDKNNIKRISSINSGYFDRNIIIKGRNSNLYLFITGKSNLLSHSSFLIKYKIPTNNIEPYYISTIPQWNLVNFSLEINNLIYFLPAYVYPKAIRDENNIKMYNSKTGQTIDINIKSNKIITSIYVEKNKKIYTDDINILNEIYTYINDAFYLEIIKNDIKRALDKIKTALKLRVETPYLNSILWYLKGKLEFKTGNFSDAEKSFKISLSFNPYNPDPVQKLCEIAFVKGNYKKALILSEKKYKEIVNFWGLHNDGKFLFRFYTNLQIGNFLSVEETLKKEMNYKNSFFKVTYSIFSIFKGDYKKAKSTLEKMLDRYPSPFTIIETRLFFMRAVLITDIISQNRGTEDKNLKLAKFYANDIYFNSKFKDHLTGISRAYFLAKQGEREKAMFLAKKSFLRIKTLARGDFESKLWLFYDSFVYGKIMEILGNIRESTRGYKECIKANPSTELAKRALIKFKKLNL